MEPNELKFMILSGGAGSNTNMRSDAYHRSLLPGIPDDITVDLIAPKLPWRTFYVLSRVSPAWLHAIRSHQIYNARVRANSTQTLAVINYVASDSRPALALFSTIDNSYRELPQYDAGCFLFCKYVTIDSKLYVLDGQFLHFMDFAGQTGWKRCAGLPQSVAVPYACRVSHGKIYVFGRTFGGNHLCELYDPKEDTWSPITPMPSCSNFYYIETNVGARVGEERFVQALRNFTDSHGIHVGPDVNYFKDGEGTLPEPSALTAAGTRMRFFMAQGKLHSIGSWGIYACNVVQGSWTRVLSHSMSGISYVCVSTFSWSAVQAWGMKFSQ